MVVEDGRTGFLHEFPINPMLWRMRALNRPPGYQRPWPIGWVTPALPYTGMQPRAQLLDNRLFIDAKVEVFGKHGSATWVKTMPLVAYSSESQAQSNRTGVPFWTVTPLAGA